MLTTACLQSGITRPEMFTTLLSVFAVIFVAELPDKTALDPNRTKRTAAAVFALVGIALLSGWL